MRFFYNNKIKNLIVKKYKFIYNKFCISIIFSYFLSCVMHVFLIIILLHKFFYTKEYVYIKKSNPITFSLYQIDQFLCETLEKKNSLNTVIPDNKMQKLKFKVNHNKIDVNLDDVKNSLNLNVSSSSVIHHQVDSIIPKTDVLSLSQKKKNMYCHNGRTNENFPYIINRTYPKYPNHARILGIEGKLIVMYDINNLGKIDNIRILSAVPSGVFERNVRSSMRLWIYESNKPKKDLTVVFKFFLNNIELHEVQKFKE